MNVPPNGKTNGNGNGNGRWKLIALSLMSALLSGSGVLVVNGRGTAALDARVTANEAQIQANKERQQVLEAWLTRVETKLDHAIDTRSSR